MNLTFYNNTGDIRQLNKSITAVKSGVTAQVGYAVTLTDPSFVMDYDASLVNANYVYVAEWGRYYYVNNRTMLNGNQIELTCHVDVLMSFKDAILSSDCIAERSASKVNPYIIDNMVGDEGTFQTVYRRSSVTPFNSTGSYLLTVAGK